MKKKKELYVNLWDYRDDAYPFQIFIGGRGIGKTFSILRELYKSGNKFVYMRRTDKELSFLMDTVKGEGIGNPFKSLNSKFGWNVGIRKVDESVGGIFNREVGENGRLEYHEQIGYAVALSTISSIRGLDFSDCTDLVFDEFIPERHVMKINSEGIATLNAIETMNRNREFDGLPPMRVWFISNATNIEHDTLRVLGVINELEKMEKRHLEHAYFKDRRLAIHVFQDNTEFIDKKKETALYQLAKGTEFYDFSINNEFVFNDMSLVEHRNLKGYVPMCAIDKAYIYKKKGQHDYFVSYAKADTWCYCSKYEHEKRAFKEEYGMMLRTLFLNTKIHFESYELKMIVLTAIL